ncbi:MAG: hypothetical protein WBA76_04925 [Phormidesmis sp.]
MTFNIGDLALAYSVPDADSNTASLSALKGKRIVLLLQSENRISYSASRRRY